MAAACGTFFGPDRPNPAMPWRGIVKYPGGATAAVISQSKLFIFIVVFFINANCTRIKQTPHKNVEC